MSASTSTACSPRHAVDAVVEHLMREVLLAG
jgi:hypothetical protein